MEKSAFYSHPITAERSDSISAVMGWASVVLWAFAALHVVIRLVYEKKRTEPVKKTFKYLYKYHLDIAFLGFVAGFIHTVLEFRPRHFNQTGYALWILAAVLFISGMFMKRKGKSMTVHRVATVLTVMICIIHSLAPWYSIF